MKRDSVFGKVIRSPIAQIAVVGLVVYLVLPKQSPIEEPMNLLPITIASDDYKAAIEAWEKVHGNAPTDEENEIILDRLAADEALFRRALELGLDDTPITDVRLKQLADMVGGADEHGSPEALITDLKEQDFARRDPILRAHLIQTMKLVARKVDVPPPHELASFYTMERKRFERPARYDLEHLYFSLEKRGADAKTDAERTLERLKAQAEAGEQSVLGDRFNAGRDFNMQSVARIGGALGSEIANTLESAPIAQWTGPLRSPYGWHLVRVKASIPAQSPPIAKIPTEVMHTYLRVRGEEKLSRTLRRLRLRYGVEIE